MPTRWPDKWDETKGDVEIVYSGGQVRDLFGNTTRAGSSCGSRVLHSDRLTARDNDTACGLLATYSDRCTAATTLGKPHGRCSICYAWNPTTSIGSHCALVIREELWTQEDEVTQTCGFNKPFGVRLGSFVMFSLPMPVLLRALIMHRVPQSFSIP